jgi:hypothetical protein
MGLIMQRAMATTLAVLLFGIGLLGSAGARAATQGCLADPVAAVTKPPSGVIQFADGGKGGDKYMSGRAGGRYGIGGSECKQCRPKKK